ncbi:MAG: alpha-galactosidase, partial [Planctomycetota bacterium]|nr:alpha-galactosidase [Planctomycetota bacterium]
LARRLEITNRGAAPAALARVSPWSGLIWSWKPGEHWGEIPKADSACFSLGFFDSYQAGSEGNFHWEPLPAGGRRIESANGHSGFGNPFFILQNHLTGEWAVLALAWSGNWAADFWSDPCRDLANLPGRGAYLAFRFGPSGAAPLRVIEAGETVVTPETHIGLLHCNLDEVVSAWYEHLRASVIPPRPRGKEFYIIAGRVVEEPGEWIHREIEIAAEMGVDAFMVDAGWYGAEFGNWWERRGDWQVGGWLPGGLKACRDLCRKRNLLFGLWMEPEAVGPKSRLLQEHPEWLLRTDGDREVAQVLDLAHPEAADFFRREILRVIREHALDFFKIDYNVRIHEGGQHLRAGFAENEGWRHYETLYATFDQVRREMPEVALECCASGGGRNDLGMMSRFHYACESDFSMFPRSIRAINGLTLFLPPEALCYYHNHMPAAHQTADLDTHLRVTLFAQPIFVGFGAQTADRDTPYFRKTKRYIRLAKE